jgi:HSP90 family molecular chaperone
LLRKALEKEWKNEYIPVINVKLYEEDSYQILEVEDNGIGMDQDIIDKYYTKVGASFYKSADFNNLRVATNAQLKPTSRFSIGILSTFMVADSLIVDTKKTYGPQDSSPSLNLTAEGHESIFWIKPGDRKTVGTTTKLILRKGKNPWDKMSDDQFVKSVKVTIPNPPFPIIIRAGDKEIIQDEKSFVNTRPSIPGPSWTKEENNKPTTDLTLEGKIVEVEGRQFPLSKFFKMADNQISIKSTTIGTDSKGEIVTDQTTDFRIKSGSVVSLHGIEVPTDLFPES